MRTATRTMFALAIATTCLAGCAAIRRSEAKSNEDLLAAAGFRIKSADTPARQQELTTMPPLKMMRRTNEGSLVFTYADPYNCKCLYVGNESNYQEYKRLALKQQIAQDQLDAAMVSEDAAMNWGMWGP